MMSHKKKILGNVCNTYPTKLLFFSFQNSIGGRHILGSHPWVPQDMSTTIGNCNEDNKILGTKFEFLKSGG